MRVATADHGGTRRIDDQPAQAGDAAAHVEAAGNAIERHTGVGAAEQSLRFRRPARDLVTRPKPFGDGDVDRAAGRIQRVARGPATATQSEVDIADRVAQTDIEAKHARQLAERHPICRGGERRLPDPAGGVVDQIETGGATADGRGSPEGEALLV
ncbi:unannotated protein [freshwater metagenome]|uniref:Unannotated protein n=1 Tax=freshwater metagenome TaxID=449393 RepID=A0A6J7RZL9_9ZZZZ